MIPEHYARDIVERCDSLIDTLLPIVQRESDARFGGPLGTTFLVAMSSPMVLLPVERMLKPARETPLPTIVCWIRRSARP